MVENTMDPLAWLGKHLEEADTDLLREMLRTFIQTPVHPLGAALPVVRAAHRIGFCRHEGTGTIELQIPKLRQGSYFPFWLLEPRRRAERALVAVVAECYLKGVSTRRVDAVVKTLGIEGISKSRVSEEELGIGPSDETEKARRTAR